MSKLIKRIKNKIFLIEYNNFVKDIIKYCGEIKKIYKNLAGGSDRLFYFIYGTKRIIVFLDYSLIPSEIDYFIKINRFLEMIKINVPKIFFIKDKIIIMEFVGNETIYKKYKNVKDKNEILKIYKKIINELIKMQINGLKNINRISIVKNKIFGEKVFRWEWEYFRDMYLKYYKKFDEKTISMIERYFIENIKKLINIKKVFLHRDFQSQNLHIYKNKIFFIDYQSAHLGPWSYDLASLLEDPYMNLSEQIKEELLKYYYRKMKTRKFFNISYEKYLDEYKITAISRLAQASGAYIKLGILKGKKHFLKYLKKSIPNLQKKLDSILNKNIDKINFLNS